MMIWSNLANLHFLCSVLASLKITYILWSHGLICPIQNWLLRPSPGTQEVDNNLLTETSRILPGAVSTQGCVRAYPSHTNSHSCAEGIIWTVPRTAGRETSSMGQEQDANIQIKFRDSQGRASLVVQWLRIHLPIQRIQVRSLVQEDATCRGATKPVGHSYWVGTLEPILRNMRSLCTATRENPHTAMKPSANKH